MNDPHLLPVVHLGLLCFWGGIVATEAVIELHPFRHPDQHPASIRLHYWIDLLVELPAVLLVLASGVLLLTRLPQIGPLHIIKVGFAAAAITVNLFCIWVVVRRGRDLERNGADERLWRASKIVLGCFGVGLLCAAVAAGLGFYLASLRLT
jgi:hypothetical protein